jgi:DNA-binding ferritin-like protein
MSKTVKSVKSSKSSKKNVTRKNTHSKSSFERKMNSLLRKIIQLQRQIKFFHWNTKNYAAHKITDEFHTTLSGLVDQLVEVSIAHKMKLANINKYYKKVKEFKTKDDVMNYVDTISKDIAMLHKKNDIPHDIKAILDTVVGELNRFKYLFVMK